MIAPFFKGGKYGRTPEEKHVCQTRKGGVARFLAWIKSGIGGTH